MKRTLLFTLIPLLTGSPFALAKDDLATLRDLCAKQERQIRQLESENAKLRGHTDPVPAAKPNAAPTEERSTNTYAARPGDSLERISRKFGTTPSTLARLNDLKPEAIIQVGQKLKVPGQAANAPAKPSTKPATRSSTTGKSYLVKQGDTFSSIAKRHDLSSASLLAANPGVKATALRPGQILSLSKSANTRQATTTELATTPAKPKPAPTASPRKLASAGSAPSLAETAPSIPVTAEKSPPKEPIKEPAKEPATKSVPIDAEITYGNFAARHGTTTQALNDLNNLDLVETTVLAKGSLLNIPAQP